MKLLVGLGNPGAKYEKTRHNIGFLAIDAIARRHAFSPERAKFQGAFSEGRLGDDKVLALKPMTFMNLSGQAVGEAMRFFRLAVADVIVFHDELDLAPGKLRVKTGGGHAGHNGLRSLHDHLGPDYHRVRLGIGHPGDKRVVANYVLNDFAKADWDWVDPLLDGVADGAPQLVDGDFAGFMNRVALKTKPPAPKPERKQDDAPKAAPVEGETPAAAPLSPLEKLARRFSSD